MASACGHRLCQLIGGDCSIMIGRSRGCHPSLRDASITPELFDEVRGLVDAIDGTPTGMVAAKRLAQILRAEANLLAHARNEEPDLAELLAKLVARR